MRPRPPPSSAARALITIMPGPRMAEVTSCDADVRGRARDPWSHDREDFTRDRNEVVGSGRGGPPCPHPPYAYIFSLGGILVEGNMKIVEEGSLDFLPHTDAAGLRSGGRQDIGDNKNERV